MTSPETPSPNLRIGHGFDVHRFSDDSNRVLKLGGWEIPGARGLAGHSDADVLLHALTDAVLGALGWDDIGAWFPDTDPQYLNIDSTLLLRDVWQRALAEGWRLINCDTVVMAERPKLRGFVTEIRRNVSTIFSVDLTRIGIKATTTERLGFIGREEGIAASAVVLLNQS